MKLVTFTSSLLSLSICVGKCVREFTRHKSNCQSQVGKFVFILQFSLYLKKRHSNEFAFTFFQFQSWVDRIYMCVCVCMLSIWKVQKKMAKRRKEKNKEMKKKRNLFSIYRAWWYTLFFWCSSVFIFKFKQATFIYFSIVLLLICFFFWTYTHIHIDT